MEEDRTTLEYREKVAKYIRNDIERAIYRANRLYGIEAIFDLPEYIEVDGFLFYFLEDGIIVNRPKNYPGAIAMNATLKKTEKP